MESYSVVVNAARPVRHVAHDNNADVAKSIHININAHAPCHASHFSRMSPIVQANISRPSGNWSATAVLMMMMMDLGGYC